MSSFLFLHFCDDALWLLGLYFSAFYPFRTFLRWLFTAAVQTSTGASRWSNRAGEELPWCSFPYPASKTAHRATQGQVLFFPQNELTPPPKGGGAGYRLSWVGRVGSVRSKLAHTPPTGRVCCFDGVVLLPSHLTGHKSPHRGEFGFCLLAGASQEDHPPFRQSRIRTQAEEKIPLPHFSEMEPVKSVIPCKRFFKPSGVKAFSLFMRRRFCAARGGPHDICSTVFSHTNSEPGLSWAEFKAITSIFGGTARPALPAPICTPRPLGWAGSCTGAHRFVLCRLFPGRWSFLCR